MSVATQEQPRTKYRFQLLAGKHVDNHPTLRDVKGVPLDRVHNPGDIIETDDNLERLNVSGFNPKFRRVMDGEPQAYQPPPKPKVVDLSSMTEPELVKFALEQDIDISAAKGKNDKLSAIRAALAE